MPRFASFGFWYKDPDMDFEYCTRHFDKINIKKKVYENKIVKGSEIHSSNKAVPVIVILQIICDAAAGDAIFVGLEPFGGFSYIPKKEIIYIESIR